MDREKFKERLLALITEEDETQRLNTLEEIANIYVEMENEQLKMKQKYNELHKKYIDTFMTPVQTDVDDVNDEEVEDEKENNITIEDLFKEEG